MENFLCKCNNCNSVLIDKNPKDDAVEQELSGEELEMVLIHDKHEYENFWACPICKNDYYLTDNLE